MDEQVGKLEKEGKRITKFSVVRFPLSASTKAQRQANMCRRGTHWEGVSWTHDLVRQY